MQDLFVGSIVPFLLVILPLVLSFGPDSLLIVRNTLGCGKAVGMAAVLGVQMGLTVHLLLALQGISLLVITFPEIYSMMVIVGALYLGWIGIQGLLYKGNMKFSKSKKMSFRSSLVTAMFTNMLNPKVLVLFFTLLPGFLSLESQISLQVQLSLLVLTLIVVNTVWQTLLVLFCHQMNEWLLTPKVNRLLSHVCGFVLLFFAFYMIYEHSW